MASINEYYIDYSGGNDTTGDGSVGTPWKTIQKALTSGSLGTDGMRINLRSNADHVLSATLTTSIAPNQNQPLLFQGYTTSAGDGGVGVIDCGSDAFALPANINYTVIIDLEVKNCTATYFFDCATQGSAIRCYFHDNSTTSLINDPTIVTNCRFELGTSETAVSDPVSTIEGCWLSIVDGAGIDQFGYCSVTNCIFVITGDGIGIDVAIGAPYTGSSIKNNSFLCVGAGASTGIDTDGHGAESMLLIAQNIFEGFATAIDSNASGNYYIMLSSNYFYSNTTNIDGESAWLNYADASRDNEAGVASAYAKSGAATYANRLAYFAPVNVGNVLSPLFNGNLGFKGAVRPLASSWGLTAGILKSGETVGDVTGTYSGGGGGLLRRLAKITGA